MLPLLFNYGRITFMEPATYTVEEIRSLLNIGKSSAYKLVNDPPFPVLKIGNAIRVPKEAFNKWLMCL